MGKALDEAFIFYASYHNNPINQWIHIICIWPIAITALFFLQYTPQPAFAEQLLQPYIEPYFPKEDGYKVNGSFLLMLYYALYYAYVEQPGVVGLFASAMILFSYKFAVTTVQADPNVWKIALVVHILSWIAQFYGHGVHEKRKPALFDSLGQAFRTAPLFVVMELAFKLGYKAEYYKHCEEEVKKNIAAFKDNDKAAKSK